MASVVLVCAVKQWPH